MSASAALYPFGVERTPAAQRAPTRGLYLGLVVTLIAVLAYAAYITLQFAGVRKLQSEMVDRNRRDSLQLLRIQNDFNSLGLAMRDMLDAGEPYPLAAWSAQFERIHNDLDAALEQEEKLSEAARTSDQRRYLSQSLAQFWDAADRMFALATSGNENAAREQIRDTLQPRLAALGSAVSRLLIQNNEGEELATAGHHRHQPVSHPGQSAHFCTRSGAFGATQRAGAKTDFGAGVHPAAHFPGAARRIWPGADGHRLDAAARRETDPGRVFVACGLA